MEQGSVFNQGGEEGRKMDGFKYESDIQLISRISWMSNPSRTVTRGDGKH